MAYLLLGKACLGNGDFEQAENLALKSIARYQEINQRDELAWALALAFFACRGLGQPQSAYPYLCQSLKIGVEIRGYYPVLCALCGAALLQVDRGDIERAVELAALAWRYPVVDKSRWFEDIAGRELTAVAESLPSSVVAAARERGRKRDF